MLVTAAVRSPARDAVHALRRARREARLGRLEWFDVAYRAYLVILVGGALVLAVGTWLPADPLGSSAVETVRQRGAAVLGLVAALVLAAGLRSGAHGGPLAVEAPDIRHLLLAPVPRRQVLLRPCAQRLSSLALVGGSVAGVAGLLAAPRLDGPSLTWTLTGAVGGAVLTAGAGALAILVHVGRVAPGAVRAVTAVVVLAQAIAVAWRVPGPTDVIGDALVWPLTRHDSALVAGIVASSVAVALVVVGLVSCGRLRSEALERRSSLVAQVRFALAVGDLRTVVLLRRQLAHDHLRVRPWFRVPPPRGASRPSAVLIWRSGLTLARSPALRLARLVVMAAAMGVAAAGIVQGSAALLIPLAVGAFLIGLELAEPLAQTVDQTELRRLLPVGSSALLGGLLVVPALALVPLAAVAVTAAAAVSGASTAWSVGAVMGIPLIWAGAAGAVVNVVRSAPDPMARAARSMAMPPEVAGMSTVAHAAWPLIVSGLGVAPLWFVSDAVAEGGSPVAAALRGGVASLLVAGCVVVWLRTRDDVRRRWRALVVAGDEARRQATERRRTRSGGST